MDVEVIEVRDGMLAETPNGEKSLDDGSKGLGTGQVRIVGRFFATELDIVTEHDPVGARELPGSAPLPVHRGQRLGRPAQQLGGVDPFVMGGFEEPFGGLR